MYLLNKPYIITKIKIVTIFLTITTLVTNSYSNNNISNLASIPITKCKPNKYIIRTKVLKYTLMYLLLSLLTLATLKPVPIYKSRTY